MVIFEFLEMSFSLTNALVIFVDLMNRMYKPYLDTFVIDLIYDILVCSKNEEENIYHFRIMLQTLKDRKLFTEFSKCKVRLKEVSFLKHVVSNERIKVDPKK